jgi:hypothetical protein
VCVCVIVCDYVCVYVTGGGRECAYMLLMCVIVCVYVRYCVGMYSILIHPPSHTPKKHKKPNRMVKPLWTEVMQLMGGDFKKMCDELYGEEEGEGEGEGDRGGGRSMLG